VVPLDGNAILLAQALVAVLALTMTVAVAVCVADPMTSIAIAITTSLVVLPVTWYHYPVALIPAAVALAVTRASSRPRIVLAAAVADLAVAFLPLTWIAAAALLTGFRRRDIPPGAAGPHLAPRRGGLFVAPSDPTMAAPR
jgi:hypothetical protein